MTPPPRPPLVLASASPRRLDLLRQVGIEPDQVDPAEIDEAPILRKSARAAAARLARLKAECVSPRHPGAFILGADTVVCVGGRLLGKPQSREEAAAMLDLISGRGHRVYTAVAVASGSGKVVERLAEARVRMARLDPAERTVLLDGEEWRGAAGGYRIQGRAGAAVISLTGSYTAVVGLPLYETMALLKGVGWR